MANHKGFLAVKACKLITRKQFCRQVLLKGPETESDWAVNLDRAQITNVEDSLYMH